MSGLWKWIDEKILQGIENEIFFCFSIVLFIVF